MTTILPSWNAVRIDVSQYVDPAFLARCGGKLYQVCLFDASQHTFCCEITPSYWMLPIDLVPETYPDDEQESDALSTDLLLEICHMDAFYMHCSAVERLEARPILLDIDPEDIPADRGESDAIETYHGNPLF